MTKPMHIEAQDKPLQPENSTPAGQYDYAQLSRMLDRVKSHVFMSSDAAFYGPLMSGLEFYWSTELSTAATDGCRIWWNPEFFLDKSERFNQFVLMHELSHVAGLHMLRQDWRDGEQWNWATDVRINNDLVKRGYSFEDFPAWHMPHLDQPKVLAEEEIYDWMTATGYSIPSNPWGNAEFVDPTPEDIQKQINNVVRSVSNAKAEGKQGTIPGGLETMIDHFLAPVLPWEQLLAEWHQELGGHKTSWRRPRRRMMSQGIYLPERIPAEDGLAHLVYMLDVSGSITNQEILRFNSELKHIWDRHRPKRMTVVQFDAKIQKVQELKVGDEFAKIEIIGRGGNDMNCVADFLDELADPATAVIIFADMQFEPMRPLKHQVPVLWVNSGAPIEPPYGKIIRVKVNHRIPGRS